MKKDANGKAARNFCYLCGKDNPHGMRLRFVIDDKNAVVRGTFRLDRRYQGPPASAHGGIIAALVDEAMGKLNRAEGVVALTAEMSVEYLRLVPLGRKIVVEARPSRRRGRNYWRNCTIHDAEGKLLARGKGRFVKIADRVPLQK